MSADQVLRWENVSSRRYFVAHAHVDLLGDQVISCYWGGLQSRLGGVKHLTLASSDAVQGCLYSIDTKRRKRGYIQSALRGSPVDSVSLALADSADQD